MRKFLVGIRSFTQYVLVQFYGKSGFCENGGFSLSGSHILYEFFLIMWVNTQKKQFEETDNIIAV